MEDPGSSFNLTLDEGNNNNGIPICSNYSYYSEEGKRKNRKLFTTGCNTISGTFWSKEGRGENLENCYRVHHNKWDILARRRYRGKFRKLLPGAP